MIYARIDYIEVAEGVSLYTATVLPNRDGTYPTVIYRSPYCDAEETLCESDALNVAKSIARHWNERGYAVVYQHCRGRGKSGGECIPFKYERNDGRKLWQWIRRQSFYNGEIYLRGGSYTASVHFCCAPFDEDIKGMALDVMPTNGYDLVYRNGFFKSGLMGGWYAGMYKQKQLRNRKIYNDRTLDILPLTEFPKAVFDEDCGEEIDILKHPDRHDPFWEYRDSGVQSMRHVIENINIPTLLQTALYDMATGAVLDTWNQINPESRSHCALIVNPYDHGGAQNNQPYAFPQGKTSEAFGTWDIDWFDWIRGKHACPFSLGKVTYYRLFENKWAVSSLDNAPNKMVFELSDKEEPVTYIYNPFAPAQFKGGLSCNFGGTAMQDKPNSRRDIKSFFTPIFSKDTFVRGKMAAKLTVSSDCEDTCFYMRISLDKEDGAFGLRDDITNIVRFVPDYHCGDKAVVEFSFDEHAFLIKKGERLRIDVSSSASNLYVRHTNNKGLYSVQTTARIAHNTIYPNESSLTIFTEGEENI